jgi:hypothetical protein
MKVFICWSEGRSKRIAEELRTWLKMVIQQIDPWMSDEDIRAGARWHLEITTNLADCKVGIICLTPENLHNEWIHFEAGALSKTVERTYVCPLLIGELDPRDVPYPLAQFQGKKADKEGMFDIIKTINATTEKTSSLSEEMLKRIFEMWWPSLEKVIKELPPAPEEKPKRNPEEMLEEIRNSVRAISNMISEQTSSQPIFFRRGTVPLGAFYPFGAGIGAKSTGAVIPEPSKAVEAAIEILETSEAPAADKKKKE